MSTAILKSDTKPVIKRDKTLKFKTITGCVKQIDRDKRTVRVIVSDETEDRDNEIVVQSGIYWKNFLKNPIVFKEHVWTSDPIGRVTEIEPFESHTEVVIQFTSEEEYEYGYRQFKLFAGGYLNAVSLGFNPYTVRYEFKNDKTYVVYTEAVEVSVTGVPANPNTVKKAFEAGDLTRKEAVEYLEDLQKVIKSFAIDKDDDNFKGMNKTVVDKSTEDKQVSEVEQLTEKNKNLQSQVEELTQSNAVKSYELEKENKELTTKVKSLEVKNDTLTKVIASRLDDIKASDGDNGDGDGDNTEDEDEQEVSDDEAQAVYDKEFERVLKE